MDGEKLRQQAQQRTELDDFDSPPLDPAFSVLVDSLEAEAQLHTLGRLLMRIHLRGLLETRLKLAAASRELGEAAAAERIEKPVFIAGMPRSGSTFLQELLGEDPDHRAPRVWEVMSPVAARLGSDAERRRHIRKAEFCLWWFRRLAPQADSVYPMRAQTPHECVAIQSYTFLSEEFVSTCNVPTYEAFLRAADLTPAYAWQKRFLQYLQSDSPGKRWVLKSPDHVHGLRTLFSVFPDAYIIQTHRNPLEVLKSSAALTRVLRGLYGPAGTLEEVQAREARVLAESTEKFIRFRDQHPEWAKRFIDVKYSDLVANPVETVRQIYEQLETPLTARAAERMKQLASQRSRYRQPQAGARAEPRLEALAEADRFERYCSRFGLPLGQPKFGG